MKTVAVTAEFNPFHNGHKYLAEKIREKYGLDTAVVAVMSGCYVQRGDVAIADPYFRAKTALLGGYDLILELPFPFSVSGAETYTRAAVELIASLRSVDAIAFGSECGDISALRKAADLLTNEKTCERLKQARQTGEGKRKGMPALIREIVKNADPETFKDGPGPNDLLAIGYLKALKNVSDPIEPFAVKRVGGRYESALPDHPEFVGATALRGLLMDKDVDIIERYIPAETLSLWKNAISHNDAPALFSTRLSDAVLASLIAADPTDFRNRTGLDEGLVVRILDAAQEALSLEDLIVRVSCRSVSDSQFRRMILSMWLGFTSPGPDERPLYTRLFGFTDRGQAVLRKIKRDSPLPILTKTADYADLPKGARDQAVLSLSADRLFGLALPIPRPASDAYRGTPCHITGNAD